MDLERAVRFHPKFFDVHLNLGWTLYVLGDAERAVYHLRTRIELSPSAADWRGTIGAAELYTGEYQKCVEDLDYYAQRRKIFDKSRTFEN